MKLDAQITVRLSSEALHKLRQEARRRGSTPSSIVRHLVEQELAGNSALELSRRWVGKVRKGPVIHGRKARTALKDWHPGRRG